MENGAERDAEGRNRFEKPMVRVFIVCSLFLAGELVWLFIVGPCMPLSSVEITGIEDLSRITVLDKAGITSRTSFLSFNVKHAEKELRTIPRVESAVVTREFPDSVRIELRGRTPAALSLALYGARTVPVLIDGEGVVFKIGDDGGGIVTKSGLPVLSGLVFENVQEGLRLPDFLVPLLRNIKELRDSAPELLSAISELRINRRTNDSFDVTLYPLSHHVRIVLGPELSPGKIMRALWLLDLLARQRIDVDEIDFRSNTASYKVKERR
ncbi:MAG: FtsQ-type POTRA domain-containing protein [Spirochaetaceae bacterium]|jgi:cell division protein FtsQ|nr:FtsQ-type POTRA domain-containing protein [Spirochaetaceae bacterium]